MKIFRRQNILAFFTFTALIVILIIQVQWMLKAARIEEETFNKHVTKALIEAKYEIGKLAVSCTEMNDFLCGKTAHDSVHQKHVLQIDSVIKSKLDEYDIDLAYTFELADNDRSEQNKNIFSSRCYQQCLNGILEQEGVHIQLEFPDRNQFIMAQLRGSFILATIAVIFVMISFVVTSRMFRKERLMVQQTSDFVNNMVHEFQTPLANIRLASNLIKKKQKSISDVKISEYIDIIISENHKLERNVDEILNVSSFGNGVGVLISLNKLIEQTCAGFLTRIETLKGQIRYENLAKYDTVYGEPSHFRLILSNLIDNAIKYSDKAPFVTISSENTNQNNIKITVADKGIGIEKKYIHQIFEKYYRVSTGKVHNVKGFGLGLTYVKKLVEFYKGKIHVSSSKGTGTVFIIILPLVNEEDKNSIG